jgi:hypothetical protein
MLSSGLRKLVTTDANATSEGERAPGLADKRFVPTYL